MLLAFLLSKRIRWSLVLSMALLNTGHDAQCAPTTLAVISGNEIIDSLKAGRAVSLENVTIVGAIDLSTLPIEAETRQVKTDISIRNSRFEGPIIAQNVVFQNRLQLTRDVFLQDVNLNGSFFQGDVDLSGSSFQKALNLSRSRFFLSTLNISGTRIAEGGDNQDVAFDRLVFDSSTDLNKLQLTKDQWTHYLTALAEDVRDYPSLYSDSAESIKSYPGQVPQENDVQYLARVVRTNTENWIERNFDRIFLDYTIGYGFKPFRLLFWFLPILLGLLAYQRRLSTERILRERNEKYPLWEERIDREFVGEPSVNLTFIPKRHRDYAIIEYRSRHKKMDLITGEDAIVSANESQINAFKTAWSSAVAATATNYRDGFASATAQLSNLLCDRLGFRQLNVSTYHDEKHGFKVSAPTVRINIPSNLALIFLANPNHSIETVRGMVELVRLLGLESRYFAVALTFFESDKLRYVIRDSGAYRSEFVVLDRKSVWEILATTSPVQRFTEQILNQVDLLAVSPFELAGPVSDKMFYGRIEEEKHLTRSIRENNFAVVANRKIGKTSLLEKVSRILDQDPDFCVFTFDLQRAEPNYDGFFRLLSKSEPFRRQASRLGMPKPTDFYEIAVSVLDENPGRRLVLIFDEIDDLLVFDRENKTQLFKTARALSKKTCAGSSSSGQRFWRGV